MSKCKTKLAVNVVNYRFLVQHTFLSMNKCSYLIKESSKATFEKNIPYLHQEPNTFTININKICRYLFLQIIRSQKPKIVYYFFQNKNFECINYIKYIHFIHTLQMKDLIFEKPKFFRKSNISVYYMRLCLNYSPIPHHECKIFWYYKRESMN